MNHGNCGKRFSAPPITSSSSHFFNKTDFEQYLFENGFIIWWKENSSFYQINQIVSGLEVINDVAESLVKFGSDYNKNLQQMNNSNKAYFRL